LYIQPICLHCGVLVGKEPFLELANKRMTSLSFWKPYPISYFPKSNFSSLNIINIEFSLHMHAEISHRYVVIVAGKFIKRLLNGLGFF